MLAFEGDSRVVWFEGNPLLERHGAERNVDRVGGALPSPAVQNAGKWLLVSQGKAIPPGSATFSVK
jgi:hypothetical protein